MSKKGFTHERPNEGATNVWLTPKYILDALGPFDLDPCASFPRPWDTAKKHYIECENGLDKKWLGRVWLNPPYGPHAGYWLERLGDHGNGIALIFARTETNWFQEKVFEKADAILFLKGRVRFHKQDGSLGDSATAPSVLIAYGQNNVDALYNSGLDGFICDRLTKIGRPEFLGFVKKCVHNGIGVMV